jgi:hypothetical protein
VAAWLAALRGLYELLMMIIDGAQVLAATAALPWVPDRVPDADLLQGQAAQVFAGDPAADRVPRCYRAA